jgi:hypothetical protein
MFERFTESARRALFFARLEVSESGGREIRPEHLLLGLIHEPKGLVMEIFAQAHVSLDTVREAVKRSRVPGERISTSVEVPFTDDAQQVLRAAAEEADRLLHNYIGTEHLLLALLTLKGSLAETTLTQLGLRNDDVRKTIGDLAGDRRGKGQMILVAGPFRSGTGDDPERMAANVHLMEAYALPLFRAGHVPVLGEWFALPLVKLAGSAQVGDRAFNEIFHPIAERLLAHCQGVLRVGGASQGADQMVAIARSRGLPVYYRLGEVPGCEAYPEPQQ